MEAVAGLRSCPGGSSLLLEPFSLQLLMRVDGFVVSLFLLQRTNASLVTRRPNALEPRRISLEPGRGCITDVSCGSWHARRARRRGWEGKPWPRVVGFTFHDACNLGRESLQR